MAHRIILGAPGSGKSEAIKLWVLRAALGWDVSISVDDRHGSLVYDLLGHLIAHGLEKRVIFERAKWTDRVLGWDFTVPSTESDPETRKVENRLRQQWWLQPTWAMAQLKDGFEKPWTKQYLEGNAGIFFTLPRVRRIDDAMKIFRRDDPEGQRMIRQGDREAAWYFEDLYRRSEGRNLNTWAIECYASMRKLEYVTHPTIYLRDGGNLNHREAMRQKKIILRDLSGVPFEAARALVIMHANESVLACQTEFEETGKSLPHEHYIDEAGAMDAVTPLLLSSLQEARKWMKPGGVRLASQSVKDFRDRDRFDQLLGYCSEHYYAYMASGIEEAAEDLAAAAYDPEKLLDTRERLMQDGFDEVSDVRKKDGKTISEGIRLVARYKTVTDKVFSDPNRQRADIKLSVAKKDPGHWTVRDMKGVRAFYEPMLGEPWALGLTKIRTDKAIERLRQSPCLSSPRIWNNANPAREKPPQEI
jgi:hypothetical protein